MNARVRPFFVLFKALGLFVLLNLAYALVKPPLADISVYNALFPGKERMPFGTGSDPLTVSVDNVEVMFASHAISARKQPDEIRVALIGDSSIWGEGLSVPETLAAQWNQMNVQCGGKTIRFYNLGYPHPSILKDLIFFDETKDRQPDLIVWFVTLNTLMKQYRSNSFLTENRTRLLRILDQYDIPFAPSKSLSEMQVGFYQQTIVGQRSFLARWIKLQALGPIWAATGEDRYSIADHKSVVSPNVTRDTVYRGLKSGADLSKYVLLDALSAGYDIAGDTPVLLVNEPIFVATGKHSDIRYNDFYPRWAYDQYRTLVTQKVEDNSWHYLDLWNAIPPSYFTNTALHLSEDGERMLAEKIDPDVLTMLCH